jgi:NTP pyrophosphatase (non-canonical NTP hydrolase)
MKTELEALIILSEECAEVVQAVSKIFRFGIDDMNNSLTNRTKLENEIGDVLALVDIMQRMDMISFTNIEQASTVKKEKLKKWSSLGEYCDF